MRALGVHILTVGVHILTLSVHILAQGVELAFTSTTKSAEVALAFSGGPNIEGALHTPRAVNRLHESAMCIPLSRVRVCAVERDTVNETCAV